MIGRKRRVDDRTRGLSDYTDRLIERTTRPAGRAIWREMKNGARSPFEEGMAGTETIRAFLEAFARPDAVGKGLHIVGHSTGAILLAALLEALGAENDPLDVRTCSLMAPACTHDVFDDVYRPLLTDGDPLRIRDLTIYNLDDGLERGDTVTSLYRKSLLYLVANAFEDSPGAPILGMQKFEGDLAPGRFTVEVSRGTRTPTARTASTTHGGFDNDPITMNSILQAILGGMPAHPFTEENLTY